MSKLLLPLGIFNNYFQPWFPSLNEPICSIWEEKNNNRNLNSSWLWNGWAGYSWEGLYVVPPLSGREKRFVPRCWGKTTDVGFEEGQDLVLNGTGASDLCRLMRKGLNACEAVRLWPQTLRTRPLVTQLITLCSTFSLSSLQANPPNRAGILGVRYYSLQCRSM